MSTHYYWLHTCRPDDSGGIRIKTSGWDEDLHYDGHECIAANSLHIEAWKWVCEYRELFPPIIEQAEFERISRAFQGGPTQPKIPEDGYYFIHAQWSGQSTMALKALKNVQHDKALPRELHIVDHESELPNTLFPHLKGFLHGYGELFGFNDSRCDTYMALGKDSHSLHRMIEQLYDEG